MLKHLKNAPKGLMVTIFIVVFVVYIFHAYKYDFESRWNSIRLGETRNSVVSILGEPFKQSGLPAISNSSASDLAISAGGAVSYSYWMVGVEATYILGFDATQTVVYKHPSNL